MNENIQKLLDAWIAEDEAKETLLRLFGDRESAGIAILQTIAEINKTDVPKSQKLIRYWQNSIYNDTVYNPDQYLNGWRYK